MDSIADPVRNFSVNVAGTVALLEACRRADVKRIVAASTGGAIVGEARPPVHEDMPPRPAAPYGASKLAMEGYLSAYAGSYGLKTCALRFSNVYGPRSFHKGSVVAHFFKQLLRGEELVVYGDGSQTRDFLFTEDLCAGVCAALRREGAAGVYQLGSGAPVSVNALIEDIRGVTGWSSILVRYENFRAGEVRHTHCDIARARRDLGFAPAIALKDGLKATWDWFVSQQPS